MALSWPVKGPVSQHFGSNPNSIQPNGHTGVDFAIPAGTPIYAPDAGVIVFEGWASTLSASNQWWIAPAYAGIVALVDHGNGLISLHGHMASTVVNGGQRVVKGQLLGYSGNTGLSTGPHLHYEILGWPLHPYNGFYGRINPSSVVSGYAEDYKDGGIVNPSPKPTKPNERVVGPNNLNQRSEANTGAPVVRTIKANTLEIFDGYVRGENVAIGEVTTNVWYKDSNGFVWSGGFTSQSTDGLADLTPAAPLAPHERRVNNANVNHRDKPNTGAAVVRVIAANSREKFDGFVRGQSVTVNGFTTDIWYKDAQGFAWAGGFTPSDTSGLADLTPVNPPTYDLKPNQRLSGPLGAIQRDKPARSGNPVRTIAGGTVETFTGYVRGESVTIDTITTDIWYVDDKGYVWAGGFAAQGTDGLSNLTPTPKPVVTRTTVPQGVRVRTLPSLNGVVKTTLPPSIEVPVQGFVEGDIVADSKLWYALESGYSHVSGWTSASTENLEQVPVIEKPVVDEPGDYSFKPDFDFVEYRPAHTNNMQNGNFPTDPVKLVLHQFDAKDKFPSIDGVIKHFQTSRSNPSSAHFAVSGDRIVQMVSLKDRAFHAGSIGNDYIGIEIDPQEDAKTVASVKKLIAALNTLYGKIFEYTKHRDVPGNATACGVDIHLEYYKIDYVEPEPEPSPDPDPVIPPDDEDEEVIIPPEDQPNWPYRSEEDIIREFNEFAVDYLIEKWRESQR